MQPKFEASGLQRNGTLEFFGGRSAAACSSIKCGELQVQLQLVGIGVTRPFDRRECVGNPTGPLIDRPKEKPCGSVIRSKPGGSLAIGQCPLSVAQLILGDAAHRQQRGIVRVLCQAFLDESDGVLGYPSARVQPPESHARVQAILV